MERTALVCSYCTQEEMSIIEYYQFEKGFLKKTKNLSGHIFQEMAELSQSKIFMTIHLHVSMPNSAMLHCNTTDHDITAISALHLKYYILHPWVLRVKTV